MLRTLTLFLCSFVLWAIVTQLNHGLSGWHVYCFVGSLFVTFAALMQPLGPGLWATILTGLVFDAHTPVAFGTHLVLFALTHLAVYRVRDRVPRNDTISRVIVAVLANLAPFLVFSFIQIVRIPFAATLWPRLIVDLVCSQVFIAIAAPWFFALQAHSLILVRVERENFA